MVKRSPTTSDPTTKSKRRQNQAPVGLSSPADVRDGDDPGDETQRNFRYQHAYGVILLIASITEQKPYAAIWCEYHEDYLGERANGLYDAYQIKTRKPELGEWELNNNPFRDSIKRFVALNLRFPGRVRVFYFVSNVKYSASQAASRIKKSPIHFLDAVRVATFDNGQAWLPVPFQSSFDELREHCQCSSAELVDVLKRLELVEGPGRDSFNDEIAHSHLPTVPGCESRAPAILDAIRDELVYAIYKASSLQVEDPARHWWCVGRDTSCDPAIVAKRITTISARALIAERGQVTIRAEDNLIDDHFERMVRMSSTATFIPRPIESAELRHLLSRSRLLTIKGPGGCGKTRLALEAATGLRANYKDGIFFTDLSSISEATLVPQAIATSLRVREQIGEPVIKTLQTHLSTKTVLMILDNCEHLLGVCAEVANQLSLSCPNVTLLATSREALHLPGEQLYEVPPMSLPDPTEVVTPEDVSRYAALGLFVNRALLRKPDFKPTSEDIAIITELCRRLDGLPLAIELAAACINAMSVKEILNDLKKSFRLLARTRRPTPLRHKTLKATIDWSVSLLHEEEETLLRRLSVFSGGWLAEAADEILSGNQVKKGSVLLLLMALVDKSLVLFERYAGRDRYRLLETIRQYSVERLEDIGETKRFRTAHRDFFLNLVVAAGHNLEGEEQRIWLDGLEMEHENLRAALEWSLVEGEDGEDGLALAAGLGRFWEMRGHLSEGRRWLQSALINNLEPTTLRAKGLNAEGALARLQGEYSAARLSHDESLEIFQDLGDKRGVAESLERLGNIASDLGENEAAAVYYRASLENYKEIDDDKGIAWVLNSVGGTALARGRLTKYRSYFEQSLALSEQPVNRRIMGRTLSSLGILAVEQGEYETAFALYYRSLQIFEEAADSRGIARSFDNLGNLAMDSGNYSEAEDYFNKSLKIRRDLGDKQGVAITLYHLGRVAILMKERAKALSCWQESLNIDESLKVKGRSVLGELASLAIEDKDFDEARHLLRIGIEEHKSIGMIRGIADIVLRCAQLSCAEGRFDRAACLLGNSAYLCESYSIAQRPDAIALQTKLTDDCHVALGKDFEATRKLGENLTLEDVVTLAL
jgi:predicted ATPase/Tfp pilus assembly protein PilF